MPADNKTVVANGFSIGYMPQKSYAFRMSTIRNIHLAGKNSEKSELLMDKMQIKNLALKPAHRLSGGETARMALCRLMMRHYDTVIFDEPTASMDMASTLAAEELIAQYCRNEPAAVILVTHSLQQAKRIADYVLFFHNGYLAEFGPADKILNSPDKPETKQFLEFYGI